MTGLNSRAVANHGARGTPSGAAVADWTPGMGSASGSVPRSSARALAKRAPSISVVTDQARGLGQAREDGGRGRHSSRGAPALPRAPEAGLGTGQARLSGGAIEAGARARGPVAAIERADREARELGAQALRREGAGERGVPARESERARLREGIGQVRVEVGAAGDAERARRRV